MLFFILKSPTIVAPSDDLLSRQMVKINQEILEKQSHHEDPSVKVAWDEIARHCMNRVCQNLSPEACNDLLEFDENPSVIINDIVQMANEGGVQDVIVEYVAELLEFHSEGLTVEELQEFAQPCTQSEPDDPASEKGTAADRNLTTESLGINIAKIMDWFT